jgi:acetamidase/formamidase
VRTKTVILTFVLVLFLFSCGDRGQNKDIQNDPTLHVLTPSPSTIAWGHYWAKTPPVLKIKSGDRVRVQTLHVGNPDRLEKAGLPPEKIEPALRDIYREVMDKGPGVHILTGPIYIEEAEPGDVLEVRILSVELAISYSYNTLSPGRGFLSGEFDNTVTKIIPLDKEKMVAHFADGIEIPLRPFFGSMGVAPPEEAGRINSAPPWIHGGNLDNKELVDGKVGVHGMLPKEIFMH